MMGIVTRILGRIKKRKRKRPVWEVYNGQIADMRRQGHTLQEIGNTVGITRERVRQILVEHYGSTATASGEFMTTMELAEVTGYSAHYILALKDKGIIEPSGIGKNSTHLWGPDCVIQIQTRGRCKICDKPIPKYRWQYCSEACRLEAGKYKNRPEAVRKAHIRRTRRWQMQHPEKVQETAKRASHKYRQKQLNIRLRIREVSK